jgi:hypothetical protein
VADYRYKGSKITIECLNVTHDLLVAVTEKATDEMVNAVTARQAKSVIKRMTPGQRIVCSVRHVAMEVGHGGFEHALSYIHPMWIKQAEAGLKALGATKHLKALLKAQSVFPRGRRFADADAVMSFLEEMTAKQRSTLDRADRMFYAADESGRENLDLLCVGLLVSRREEFFVLPGEGSRKRR